MLTVAPPCQPTKPPQLLVPFFVSRRPLKTHPSMFVVVPLAGMATMPPWVPSPLTLLWMTVPT